SGLKMLQPLDLGDNKNTFVSSVILISGVGGLAVTFGKITLTTTACALILGILVNLLLSKKKNDSEQ
ncbi:MAG: uracil-xanthine permease, partial [Ruminococcus sp.]|nr:uracil-xanthine permease [Candidatus Apopatosoma intestinale]